MRANQLRSKLGYGKRLRSSMKSCYNTTTIDRIDGVVVNVKYIETLYNTTLDQLKKTKDLGYKATLGKIKRYLEDQEQLVFDASKGELDNKLTDISKQLYFGTMSSNRSF